MAGVSHPLIQSRPGTISAWISLLPGRYPLLLQDADNGRFLAGGIETLAETYATVFLVDRNGRPDLMVASHGPEPSNIRPIDNPGTRARLFNLAPDLMASFCGGAMQVDSVPYGYVYSSVVPISVTEVTTSAGTASVDHSSGVALIGTTGTADSRDAISLAGWPVAPPAGRAVVRILNAVPGAGELVAQVGAIDTLHSSYTIASRALELNEGKYSLTIRQAGGTETLAQISGIELIGGRRYVMMIGPRSGGSADGARYRVLVVQE
jgi:hypothetical protein